MVTRKMNDNVLEIFDENNGLILSISEEITQDKTMHITLAGDIKNEAAHELEDEMMAALTICKKLELNFEKVNYIASMTLKSLLAVQQMIDVIDGAELVLIKVPKKIMEVFDESGFSDILDIKKD